MSANQGGFGRATLLLAISWLSWGSVCQCPCLAADAQAFPEAAYAGCPDPQPLLETNPGQTLYWHDPCDGGSDPCDYTMCWEGEHSGTSPRWYAVGELLALFRHHYGGTFQSLGEMNNGGFIVLGTSNFDDEFAGGARALIGRTLGDWYRLEASYFGSHNWSDSAAIRNTDANAEGGTGNLFSPFTNFGDPAGVLGLDYNEFASIAFASSLDNIEINLRRRIRHIRPGEDRAEASMIIGLRYVNVRESFDYLTQASVPAPLGAMNSVAVRTDNDLFGVQWGWLSQVLIRERGWIDFEVKGVVFGNQATQRTVYTNVDNDGVTTTFADDDQDDVASFMVDLSLTCNYQFARAWTLRAGYNAIFAWGLALASENFNNNVNTLLLGPAEVQHAGHLIYHGPSIAVVWSR